MPRDRVRPLAIAAIGCFIASLLLPAMDLAPFGRPFVIRGWQATAAGVDLLARAGDLRGYVLGAAAAMNLVFPAAVRLASGAPGRRFALVLAAATLAGLSLALTAPQMLEHPPSLRAGYPVWIAAYVLLLAALHAHLRRPAAPSSSDENVS